MIICLRHYLLHSPYSIRFFLYHLPFTIFSPMAPPSSAAKSPIITSTQHHLPPPATTILAPLSFSLNHTHLLHSHSTFACFSSFPYLPFPANLSLPHVPSFFNCSVHSSVDLRRFPNRTAASSALSFLHSHLPTSRVGRMAGLLVNRHKPIPMMGQYRSSDDHVSEGIRVGPLPVATATAMQCGGRKPDDAVLEVATATLMSQDNRGCTMPLGMTIFDPTLSSPPKSLPSGEAKFHIPLFTHPSRERKIDDGGLCCGSFGAVESTKNQHLDNDIYAVGPEYIDDVISKYLLLGDPDCSEKMLMKGLNEKLIEGKSHSMFMLHPQHYVSLNKAYTALDSAYKLLGSDFLSLILK